MERRGPRKTPREKDLTDRYLSGELDEDRLDPVERFSSRSKHARQAKILRTALLRAEEPAILEDIDALPVGQVIQVHSLYSEVEHEGVIYLCVLRKTLMKLAETHLVVGDRVRFRALGTRNSELDLPEAVIEQVLPRETVLRRAASFRQREQDPIVANADQMLIVASLAQPRVKWGLIDRMIIAARSGGLEPLFCLNKVDLAPGDPRIAQEYAFAQEAMRHYESLGVSTLQASASQRLGLEELRDWLKDRTTVLAGHSGVGKSSLINAIQPTLNLRVGEVSRYNEKGRHTTTSARRFALDFGAYVIDTPGVKLFGLWQITPETLIEHFPDVADGSAPQWRQESYERLLGEL